MADQLPNNEVQEAFHTALDGNVSFNVHDARDDDAAFPYMYYGQKQLEAERNKQLFVSWVIRLELHVHSAYNGSKELNDMINEALTELDNAVMPGDWAFLDEPTDHVKVVDFVEFQEEDMDENLFRHGVVTVQVRVQPTS